MYLRGSMNGKKFIQWLIPILIMLVIALGFIYRKSLFNQTRDKIYALIFADKDLVIQGETTAIQNKEFVKDYFDKFGYESFWTDTNSHSGYRQMLLSMLAHADSLGLDPKDYHQQYIAKYDSVVRLSNYPIEKFEAENELVFTDAAITFLYHVAYGKEIPVAYNGVDYNIDSTKILNVFHDLILQRDWRKALAQLEPKISQYNLLKANLNATKFFLSNHPGIDTLLVRNDKKGLQVASLKLQFYGHLGQQNPDDTAISNELSLAVKNFQKLVGIDTSGQLDKSTIAALNFPLEKRVEQIKESLNYWRWTGRVKEEEFILVNLPAARLQIVNRDSTHDMNMRVIVGKTGTQTPQFTSYVTSVITYPYWHVPYSIATKEMLPKIKRNPGYMAANELELLNNKGKVLNPYKINWSRVSPKNFKYKIRQSTGCDNSLGVLKFDLNSPFSIYLHDTNRRDLFKNKDRFMSHGCVRVEKPMELAHYLLDEGLDSTTTAKLNQCLKDEKPTTFKLSKKTPVLILYMTADVNENGMLLFYKDIYNKETTTTKKAA